MSSVTSKIKVFVLDPLWNELVTKEQTQQLKYAGYDIFVDDQPKPLNDVEGLYQGSEPRILVLNPDYVEWKLAGSDYAPIPHLKAIYTASTSFEWIDMSEATKKGIAVCNSVNFSTEAVAEWAVLTLLNLARQVPRLINDGFPLDYDQDFKKYCGIQLKGKTAGIIGLGHIGAAIAERCEGLGMKVIYWNRTPKETPYASRRLEDVFKEADVVFPTLSKNSQTVSLISQQMIESIKPTAIVIDMARDVLSNEMLLEMAAKGRLFGYGFEAHPKSFKNYKGNVWGAPAYAWATRDSMVNCTSQIVENLLLATKGTYPTRVN